MVMSSSTPKKFAFPATDAQVVTSLGPKAELHAGGTDVVDRLRHGQAHVDTLVHLRKVEAHREIQKVDGLFSVGALTSLHALAVDQRIRDFAPVLATAAKHTATPQIRHRATVGGALFQRPRCVYFREPTFDCLKTGGSACLAKEGDHHGHAIFQNGVCAAPHPSTLAAALMALDASVAYVAPGAGALMKEGTLSVEDLFTIDLTDPRSENALPKDAFVTHVFFPARVSHRGQAYRRASARQLADWADVEVAVVLDVVSGVVSSARVVLGAVGRTPIRAKASEEILRGKPLTTRAIKRAASASTTGATPLSQNQWKVDMTQSLVEDALDSIRLGQDGDGDR